MDGVEVSEDHVVTLSDTFTVSGHAVGAGWKRTIFMFIRQCISFELNCVYGMVCIHVCVCCDVDHCQSSVLCHCVCVCVLTGLWNTQSCSAGAVRGPTQ